MSENADVAERVRVVIRVRPSNDREERHSGESHLLHTLEASPETAQVHVSKKKSNGDVDREMHCTFDRVFGENASQTDVFDYLQDGIQQITQGYNCTIFAYGQTGTGKTHTMLGKDVEKLFQAAAFDQTESSTGMTPTETWGIIPRAISSLFEELHSIGGHGSAGVVHLSYMQVYNNDIFDLLRDSSNQRAQDALAVREMIKGNGRQIYVSGLSEFRVTNVDEALKFLRVGNRNRSIRATEYNEKSSRSHAVLQLSIEVESRGLESAATIIRRAKLNLVDLAGSEKWGIDSAMGADRTKELTSINQSLSALGNVISALTNPRRTHIPYRDSKLTRLLQDSLGGNTRTVVIATISPSVSALEESISTLQFAERAKCVAVKVKANELVDDAILLAQAQREISRLKLLLKQSRTQSGTTELDDQVKRLTQENTALSAENQKLRRTITFLRKSLSEKTPQAAPELTGVPSTVVGSSKPPAQASKANGEAVPPLQRGRRPRSANLTQLRLDIPQDDDEDPRKPAVMTAFDEHPEERRRLQADETNEQRILANIQAERRMLESQLEQLTQNEAMQTGRSTENYEDEDLCPMCRRLIDDHSDNELDHCIEREAETKKRAAAAAQTVADGNPADNVSATTPQITTLPHQPPSSNSDNTKGPRVGAIPRPPSRRSATPNTDASPYAQELVVKSTTTTPMQSNGTRQVVRPATNGKQASDNTATEPTRPKSNNQSDPHPVDQPVPILRQGHKSVRALKQLHASSPYNATAAAKAQKDKINQPRRERPGASPHIVPDAATTSNDDGSANGPAVTNSVRDIGLRLSVYKFRYDCWYLCTIVGFDAKRRLHCCLYDCGDKQWQDLTQPKLQILGRNSEPE